MLWNYRHSQPKHEQKQTRFSTGWGDAGYCTTSWGPRSASSKQWITRPAVELEKGLIPVSPLDPQYSALLLCFACCIKEWSFAGVVKFESFHWHISNEDHEIFPFFYQSLRRDNRALLVKCYSSCSTKSVCLVYKFVEQWQGVNASFRQVSILKG